MKNQKGFTTVSLIVVLFVLAAIGGWIANVIKIISAADLPVTGLFIFRCVGIFVAPLGAILGFC